MPVVGTAGGWPAILPPGGMSRLTTSGREAEGHDALLFIVLLLRSDGHGVAADHTSRLAGMTDQVVVGANVETECCLGCTIGGLARSHWVRLERREAFREATTGIASRGKRTRAERWSLVICGRGWRKVFRRLRVGGCRWKG